ncbi:MAG TPA: DUF2271 domain-containing protein [Saprospiraceae bacterium]|nr:DUF2271 domain-containing protein [Saprospiraceae bacterium]
MKFTRSKINQVIGFICLLTFSILGSYGFKAPNAQVSHKCLIQLSNYTGEGAYVVVSLLDTKGKYVKTLQVFGKDKKWWDDIPSWFKHLTTSKEKVDGVTGASITAGDRKVFTLNTEDTYFNKGYKLRFESAVENQDYKEKDVEIEYSDENVGKNINGSGYIRYIKLLKANA